MSTDATLLLNGLTMGTDTKYAIAEDGIKGLGVPDSKSADFTFDGRDGVFAAPDFLGPRLITVELVLLGDSPEDVFALLGTLNTAWGPARDGVDLELTITVPDWGGVILLGRPRGVEADVTDMKSNTMRALCAFLGTNPNFTGA